jgi:serine/threonine protein kinase
MSENGNTDRRKSADQRGRETMLPGADGRSGNTPSYPDANNPEAIPMPLNLGEVVATEVLARGGMGMTFLGILRDDSNKRVVVKIPLTAESQLLDRFKNEIRILSQLSHPNIVRFIEAGESDIPIGTETRKLPWLAMEFVSGSSLRATLKQKPNTEWKDVHILLENILQALNHLHSKNLCHRDIKPDNLIYDPQAATWKLVDFGIAKEMVDNLRLTMTMVESNPGAWDYMSPEQSHGKKLDIRSDIYSLGLTAWEALIGVVPRPGASFPSAMLGRDIVPPDVDKLLAKMTAHNADDRYQSPAEALEALRVGAGVIDEGEKRRKRRKKALRYISATVGTAALGSMIWLVGNQFETQRAMDMVASVPQSDTRNTRIHQKLAIFRNDHSFWGRRYADEQYAKTEQLAANELQKMKDTFAAIRIEIADPGRPDDYKFNRCEAFCKTYEDVFGDASEVNVLLTQRAIFDSKIIAAKADALAARGQTKEAVDLCDEAKTRLTLPEAAALIAETRSRIADAYAKSALTDVETLLNSKTEQDWLRAQISLVQIEKIVGPTPATQSNLKKADDLLWASASDEANSDLNRKDLDSACKALDRYVEVSELKSHKAEAIQNKDSAQHKTDDDLFSSALENANAHLKQSEYALAIAEFDNYLANSPLKLHRDEAEKDKDKVRGFEDNNDWETTTNSASMSLSQNTFKQASDAFQKYIDKWPNGQHLTEARQSLDLVVDKHFQYLGDIQNYDDFIDEFNKVCEMYPGESARLQVARNWLVYHNHNEIGRLYKDVRNNNLLSSTALDKISQLKYSKADLDKRKYLDDLSEALRKYLQSPTVYTANYYLYLWQRPPSDCVKMSSGPTVFFITLESIDVSLSSSDYEKAEKQGFGGTPRIRVIFCQDNSSHDSIGEIFRGLGNTGQNSFSIRIDKPCLFEKGSEMVLIALDGEYSISDENNIESGRLDNATTGANQTATWNFSGGTSFTLHYSMQ